MKIIKPAGFSWGATAADFNANLQTTHSGFRLKVPALCADCNSVWLGRVEKKAKPKLMAWMAGLYSSMTYEDQRLLSFWAVKTAMTVQIAQQRVEPLIPMAQYPRLRAAKTQPPSGFYVWAQVGPRSRGFELGMMPVHAVGPPFRSGYEVTLNIRHLGLRIVGCHQVGHAQAAKTISELEGFANTMDQIWPPVSAHLYTPPLA